MRIVYAYRKKDERATFILYSQIGDILDPQYELCRLKARTPMEGKKIAVLKGLISSEQALSSYPVELLEDSRIISIFEGEELDNRQ